MSNTNQHPRPNVVAYHGGCPDGLAAAAVVYNYFNTPTESGSVPTGPDSSFVPMTYEKGLPLCLFSQDAFGIKEGGVIMFVDYCPTEGELLQLKDGWDRVIVLDHHERAAELSQKFPTIVAYSPVMSGAVMAWAYFYWLPFSEFHVGMIPNPMNLGPEEMVGNPALVWGPRFVWGVGPNFIAAMKMRTVDDIPYDKDYLPSILAYVQDRDLWKWELPNSREASAAVLDALSSLEDDEMGKILWFVEWINNPSSNLSSLRRFGGHILATRTAYAKRHAKRADRIEVYGCVIYRVNATECASECGEQILEMFPDCDVALVWRGGPDPFTMKCSFRSRANSVDGKTAFDMASRIPGGGGHRNAAGATLSIDRLILSFCSGDEEWDQFALGTPMIMRGADSNG